jgi:HD-like signal output (HDOD) protein
MSTLAPRKAAEFVASIADPPSLSALTAELLRLLESDNVTARQILKLLAQDPILSAKVVRLANSSFYGGLSAANLDQAIMRVGFREVRNVALTSAVMDAFPDMGAGYSMSMFWQHCIASGMASYLVAQAAPQLRKHDSNPTAGSYYVCGMLHHVGILLHALNEPKAFKLAVDLTRSDQEPLYLAERQILGFDHADSGACLLERWSFPQDVQSAVRFHHQPEQAPEEDRNGARVLHVASMLCHSIQGDAASFEGHVEGFDEQSWFGLGFDTDALEPLQNEVDKAVRSAEKLAAELFR